MNDNDIRAYNVLRRARIISIVNAMLIFKDSGIKGVCNKIKQKKEHKRILKYGYKCSVKNKTKECIVNFHEYTINVVFQNYNLFKKYRGSFTSSSLSFDFYVLGKGKKNDLFQYVDPLNFVSIFEERSFIYILGKELQLNNYSCCYKLLDNDNFNNNLAKIMSSVSLLKLLANYENKSCITAKASTFFDFYGTNYYSGGAERYLIDLYEVCKELGFNFDIYQNAKKDYFRKYRNINVIGMHNKNVPLNYSVQFLRSQSKKYLDMTRGKSNLHIFSAFYEIYPQKCSPSIGISHGISWDDPSNVALDGSNFWGTKKMYIDSAMACDNLISVDTNTANWFQTIDYKLGNQKIKVIPNYVDTKEFCPDESFKKKGKIVITYPRRLYEPRGMYLLLDIVDELFAKYKNLEIHFVGKGFDEDVIKVNEKMKKYPKKLYCYSKEPEKMNEVYKMTDISLVPTLYSEGTSLSCLEAMASGNIVICTRIGGLTDLIINGLNGYQIEPNKTALLETLENIIDNFDKQNIIRKNAINTAKALNKNLWKSRWKKEIESFDLKDNSNNVGLVEFYVKDANNISDNIIDKIKEELSKNNLIYLRSNKKIVHDNITFGLLQLVDIDEEIVSVADRVYVETGLKVLRKEKITEIK